MEPTDRSMPPSRIDSVMPKAITALIDTWRITSKELLTERKLGAHEGERHADHNEGEKRAELLQRRLLFAVMPPSALRWRRP